MNTIDDLRREFRNKDRDKSLFPASYALIDAWDKATIIDDLNSRVQLRIGYMKGMEFSSCNHIRIPEAYINAFIRALKTIDYLPDTHKIVEIDNGVPFHIDSVIIPEDKKMNDLTFEQELVKTTMEYPGGCDSGKREFLAKVFGGYDKIPNLPSPRRRIVIEVDRHIFNRDVATVQAEFSAHPTVEQDILPATLGNLKIISVEDI